MFYSPNTLITQTNTKKMISKLLRELIMNAEREKIAREFWDEIDRLAQKYEVTSDYILQEFYIGDKYQCSNQVTLQSR